MLAGYENSRPITGGSTGEVSQKSPPTTRNLDLLREEEFGIWLDDEEDDQNFQSGTDYWDEILHVYIETSLTYFSTANVSKLDVNFGKKSKT